MYPRNAASPPRIAIGAVVQISDGAVQSSGVSIVVRPEGGSETAGGGTVSYGGSSNVVYYAPTQAETNYTAFVITAYKSGCVPVSVTVVTTAESVPGKVSLGASQAADITGNLNGNVTGSVNAVTNAVTLPTIPADWITASGLAADAVAEIQSGLATQTLLNTVAGYLDTEIAQIIANTNTIISGVNVTHFGGTAGTFLFGLPTVNINPDYEWTGFYAAESTGQIMKDLITAVDSGTGVLVSNFTTGAQNLINSEVDTALTDYDAPTKAELDAVGLVLDTKLTTLITGVNVSQWAGYNVSISSINFLPAVCTQTVWDTGNDREAGFTTTDASDIPVQNLSNLDATVSTRATVSDILAGGDIDGFSLEKTLKLCLAALAGKVSGAGTTTIIFRAADDSTNRITATVDVDGNRTTVTLNAEG